MTSHFMHTLGTISLHTKKLNDVSNPSLYPDNNWPPQSQSVNPNLVCGPAHNYLNQILTQSKSIFNIRPNNDKENNTQTSNTPSNFSPNQFKNSPKSTVQSRDESNMTPPNSPNVNSPLSLASPGIMQSLTDILQVEEENVAPPISSSSSFSESSSSLPLVSPFHSLYSKNSTKISNSARKGNDRPVSDSCFGQRKKCKRNLEEEFRDEDEEGYYSPLSDEEFEEINTSDDDDVIVLESEDDKKRKIKPLLKVKKVKRSSVKKQKDIKKKPLKERDVKMKNTKSKNTQKKLNNDGEENQQNGKKEKRKYQRKNEKIEKKEKKEKKVVPKKKQNEEQEQKAEVKQDPKNNEITPAGKTRVRHYMKKRDNGSEPWVHQTQLNPSILGKMRQGVISFPEGVKQEMTIIYSTQRLKSDCSSNIFWSLQDRLGKRVKESFAEKDNNELKVKVPKSKEATFVETFLHTYRQNTTGKPNFEVKIKVKNEATGEEIELSCFSTSVHSHKYESSSSGKKSDQTHGVLMDVVGFV